MGTMNTKYGESPHHTLLSSNKIGSVVCEAIPRIHTGQPHFSFKRLFQGDIRIYQPCNNDEPTTHSQCLDTLPAL